MTPGNFSKQPVLHHDSYRRLIPKSFALFFFCVPSTTAQYPFLSPLRLCSLSVHSPMRPAESSRITKSVQTLVLVCWVGLEVWRGSSRRTAADFPPTKPVAPSVRRLRRGRWRLCFDLPTLGRSIWFNSLIINQGGKKEGIYKRLIDRKSMAGRAHRCSGGNKDCIRSG